MHPPSSKPLSSLDVGSRQAFGWILLLAIVMIGVGLGLRDPWPADEPRFAQVAREMVYSGDWLFPTRGGVLYSDKPPLFMWMIAALYQLTGSMRVAFLLPSALAGLGTLVLTHDIARRLWNRRIANVAALLLLAALQFILQARTAQIDAFVCFWIALGTYGLLRHLVIGPALRWYWFAWFAMGLGIISKGVGFLPIFMLLPWVVLLLLGTRVSEERGGVESVPTVTRASVAMMLGPIALLAAVGLWLVPMLLAVQSGSDPAALAYRDDILLRQTAERYTDSWTHLSPWWYLPVQVIPVFWLPITLLVPWLLRPWAQAFRTRDPRVVLPLVWVVLVVLFFSASPGKRGVYVLPALPMLALAAAPYAEALLARPGVRRVVLIVLGALAVLFLATGIAGLAGLDALARAEAEEGIRPWALMLVVGLCLAAATVLAWRHSLAPAWFVFVVPLWTLYGTWGYAVANDARTPAPAYRQMLALTGEEVRAALPDFREQWLLFAPVPVTHFGYHTNDEDQQRELWRWLAEPDPDALPRRAIVSDRIPLGCFDLSGGLPLGRAQGREWMLLSPADRAATCPAPRVPVLRFDYSQPGALPVTHDDG